jgi:hypothetical protein
MLHAISGYHEYEEQMQRYAPFRPIRDACMTFECPRARANVMLLLDEEIARSFYGHGKGSCTKTLMH